MVCVYAALQARQHQACSNAQLSTNSTPAQALFLRDGVQGRAFKEEVGAVSDAKRRYAAD